MHRSVTLLLNVAHAIDHLFLLIFALQVVPLQMALLPLLIVDHSWVFTGRGVALALFAVNAQAQVTEADRTGGPYVPTPPQEILSLSRGQQPKFPVPFVMKPPREGSSVGVHIIRDRADVAAAMAAGLAAIIDRQNDMEVCCQASNAAGLRRL